jgi:hypothetical protein
MGRYLDIAKRAIEQAEQSAPCVAPESIGTDPAHTPAPLIAENRQPFRLPRGVRLVRYEPKPPPIAIDVCSIVVDVERFIQTELAELDARLHSPIQIRGGWGVFTILDRLRQVGLELEIEPVLEKPQTGPMAAHKTSGVVFRTLTSDGGAG